MGSTLERKIKQLSPKHRAEVNARANELILQEMSLRALRKDLKRTQVEVAKALSVGQDTVSRLEGRCNIMLSTLNRYIKAIGGEMFIVAEFPDRPAVKLTFDDVGRGLDIEEK